MYTVPVSGASRISGKKGEAHVKSGVFIYMLLMPCKFVAKGRGVLQR